MRQRGGCGGKHELHLLGQSVLQRGGVALVGHMDEARAGLLLQQLALHLQNGAVAARGKRQLAGLGLGGGQQVGHRLERLVGAHHQDVGDGAHGDHGLERRDVVVGQLGHQVRGDGLRADGGAQQREPVGRRLGHVGRANGARGPGLVVHDDVGGQGRAQLEGDVAAQHIGAATGGVRHHPGDELARRPIVLRPGGQPRPHTSARKGQGGQQVAALRAVRG